MNLKVSGLLPFSMVRTLQGLFQSSRRWSALASMRASSRFFFVFIRRLLLDLLFIIILLYVVFLWFWWFRWLRSWFYRWSALSSPVVGLPPFTWC